MISLIEQAKKNMREHKTHKPKRRYKPTKHKNLHTGQSRKEAVSAIRGALGSFTSPANRKLGVTETRQTKKLKKKTVYYYG